MLPSHIFFIQIEEPCYYSVKMESQCFAGQQIIVHSFISLVVSHKFLRRNVKVCLKLGSILYFVANFSKLSCLSYMKLASIDGSVNALFCFILFQNDP